MVESAKETLPKFQVIELNPTHFLSCETLLKRFCTNRKKTVDKKELNWFKFRKISYQKGYPLKLFFETYNDVTMKYDETIEFKKDLTKILSVAKRDLKMDEFIEFSLPVLYPEGRAISTKKKADLLELLEFIPIQFRAFYTGLNHSETEETESQIEEIIQISDEE